MKINIGSKIISSVDFSNAEIAWMIDDASLVLEYLRSENKIVLGGDVLTNKLEHTYDSWYYNVDSSRDFKFNVECSIKSALEYISNYISANGSTFFVVFVIKGAI